MTFLDDNAYNRDDVRIFSATQEKKLIAEYLEDRSNPFSASNGWKESSVFIHLPKEKMKWPTEGDAPQLEIKGVHHRSLVNIITEVFEDSTKVSEEQTMEVFSEAYCSPAMMEAYIEVNSLARKPDNNLERVMASLMIYSDSTHLLNFSDASLWPFYLFFGNESKYTCGKPTAMACHHVAYIPTIPDDFQDSYFKLFEDASSPEVYTHCKCELVQAIWRCLLDEDFMHAYEQGIVICCGDRITCRVFLRFFCYSADYPEKILLARIKFLGECLCPHCLIKKADVSKMGTESDMLDHSTLQHVDNQAWHNKINHAHKLIFQCGAPVDGKQVKSILNSESLVPTHNAFSDQLFTFGFNLFLMFVVDMLHEFKLSIWKAIFTHLMHIAHAAGGNVVKDLNWRYAAFYYCHY
ncbi:hypothetical protein BDR04DRAFT_1129377 [Suillus decipiens]|nr:hypothetical protein BDR04DRAFT_1129377 [Suillus decipiens]